VYSQNCTVDRVTLEPHPTSCSRYIVCLYDRPLILDCPSGYYYNPTDAKCIQEYNNNRPPSFCYNPCHTIEYGLLHDTSNCQKYLACFRYQVYSETCPNNMLFDRITSQCRIKSHVLDCPYDWNEKETL